MTNDWDRYGCQVALPGFGVAAQQRLTDARILIVGAGGLGCPAAQYLAAAGVGTIAIADDDVVSAGNLHRQVLYTPDEAGQSKAMVIAQKLQKQNPGINIIPLQLKITTENVLEYVSQYDLVVDCTDNFEARYLLNDAAVLAGKPLIYGAIYQYEGQVAVWNVKNADGTFSPNYRDVFPEVDETQIPNCAVGGVIPTLAGIIGCMQANEAIKLITQTGELLAGKMLLFDAQTLQSRIIKTGATPRATITNLAITYATPEISWIDFMSSDQAEYRLIDVRSLWERELHDIGGRHIPLDELIDHIDSFDPKFTYVFYCATGKRSTLAVKLLAERAPGIKTLSLKDGLDEAV